MLVVLFLVAQAPAARGAGDPLSEARAEKQSALAEVRMLTERVERLRVQISALEAQTAQAAAHLVDAYRHDLLVDAELDEARDTLAARARAAYQAGPAGLLEVLLAAGNPSDVAMVQRVIDEQILGDVSDIAHVLDDRTAVEEATKEVERRKRKLARQRDRLESLLTEMGILLARAQDAAHRAGQRVRSLERQELERRKRELERQEEELARAAERVEEVEELITGGTDQTELLELLGPDGGRGCDIPAGLRATGKGFEGLSSWYGWDFAGRPTASGAIFDPRLFTAAHRTLPLPTFLHVRHGDRCATVLVNDRGPFIEGRVLDLSKGAADYLGLGLGRVEAEILAPTR